MPPTDEKEAYTCGGGSNLMRPNNGIDDRDDKGKTRPNKPGEIEKTFDQNELIQKIDLPFTGTLCIVHGDVCIGNQML